MPDVSETGAPVLEIQGRVVPLQTSDPQAHFIGRVRFAPVADGVAGTADGAPGTVIEGVRARRADPPAASSASASDPRAS